MSVKNLTWIAVVVMALVVSAPGCQRTDAKSSLRERADRYWGLKQSKAWQKVYDEYLDPDVKPRLSKEAFLKRRWLAFDILSYEIKEVTEEGDTATVVVANEANIPIKAPDGELKFFMKAVTTKDRWVRREGGWYVDLKE